jgi:phenylacetate-CoA ligase
MNLQEMITPMKTFMPVLGSETDLEPIQLRGLKWTVKHAYAGSPFYRKRMQDAGVNPKDIRHLDDLGRLPFTTADDLRTGYPFPLLAVPSDKVVRIHASSGTTGKRKVLCYTAKDIRDWADMFARCYEMAGLSREDRVQIAVGYGLWTAGAGFQLGCERFGAMAVPVGPGNLDMHTEMMVDLQTTVLCCTASMGLLLAEEVRRRGLENKVGVRKVIFGAERHSAAMRRSMKENLGAEDTFDIPGLTELYGPGTGLERRAHEGWTGARYGAKLRPVRLAGYTERPGPVALAGISVREPHACDDGCAGSISESDRPTKRVVRATQSGIT